MLIRLKIVFAALMALLFMAGPARAELKVGDKAPDFEAQASMGGQVYKYSLAEALKKGPVVVYFYPAAFTKGCTVEAHMFADAIGDYQALGASVIGVSHDDIDKLNRFSVSECRSKFPVAADPDGAVIKAYDAVMSPLSLISTRVSYVILPDHTIAYVYSSLDPREHVKNTLKAIKDWKAGGGK